MSDRPAIALFRGRGVVSRIIRWQTRSQYSHAAWVVDLDGDDARVWEAYHQPLPFGGVRYLHSLADGHAAGTQVHLYTIDGLTEAQHTEVTTSIAAHVGERYDWRGVFRFMTRVPHTANAKWFCSEIIAAHLLDVDVQLLETPPSHTQPGMLAWSPLTQFSRVMTVGAEARQG